MTERLTRLALATGALGACAALASTLVWRPEPLLLWNASASSPVGLYSVSRRTALGVGEMAIAWPPAGARDLAARRQYLPSGIPLVKRVAAVTGSRVCAWGRAVSVGGERIALRRARDRSGRAMPWWSGCLRLGPGELFLLSQSSPDSFDGRYFGVSKAREIIGVGRLLWGP